MAILAPEIESKALAGVRTLSKFAPVRAAYVFGSQVEGRADRWSDIDLAAFMDGVENWGMMRRADVMATVMDEAGIDVEAHLFPASSFENPLQGSFAQYIMQHGVRIQG